MADSQDTTTRPPAFQFYPKDYLSDAKTRAMTFKQRGMYWDLVSHCWLEGSLPANPQDIARILGITTPARFAANDWPVIGRCFRLVGDAHQHPRLEIERRKQADHREERSGAGRKGAERRWHRDDKPMAQPSPSHAVANGSPIAKNSSSSPSSSASSDSSQNATRSPRAIQTGGVMAGSLPRDHANCRPPCVRVCISEKQFGLFVQNHGGSEYEAEAFVTDWLVRKRAGFPAGPIGGEKPWAMWERLWNADFPSAAALAGQGKTAGNLGNLQRFAAKGRA